MNTVPLIPLLAQAGFAGVVGYYVIGAIIIAAILGIGFVAARAAGIPIPA